jgi:hypothetical protein
MESKSTEISMILGSFVAESLSIPSVDQAIGNILVITNNHKPRVRFLPSSSSSLFLVEK